MRAPPWRRSCGSATTPAAGGRRRAHQALRRRRTKLVFVESFARTQHLSLTGKLLYRVVDVFLVQWPALAAKYPRAQYRGLLV